MPEKLSLAAALPELAAQADGWDPATVTPGSSKSLRWRCANGHTWDAKVKHRTNGSGCPYCSGRRAISGENDLLTVDPDLAAQADGWNPSLFLPRSNQRKAWRCAEGHQWQAVIASRSSGKGCPYCAKKRTIAGETDLATSHPNIAAEADGWDPTMVRPGANQKVSWRCARGHRWEATIANRSKGKGCPYCSGRLAIPGESDLATLYPDLATSAYGWDPSKVRPGSNRKVAWWCEKGHAFEATVVSRVQGSRCPICLGAVVLPGFNDLATLDPQLASQAFGWDPWTVTIHSNRRLEWECGLGHHWRTSISNRTNGSACPYCAGKRVLAGFNDLATLAPDLAAEADGWNPTTVRPFAHVQRDWRCNEGHAFSSSIAARSGGSGCPVCANKEVRAGINDLATTNPDLALEACGWDPSTLTVGSNKSRRWRCERGHEWDAPPSRRNSGRGCPSCSKTGFDPGKDGWLYFLKNPDLQLLQIGITNMPANRLSKHERAGWQILEVRGPMEGRLARGWEQSILRVLRRSGAPLGDESIGGRFDGYTEAWSRAVFPIDGLRELMNLVHEEELE